MGQFQLRADPNSLNLAGVQGLINDFNNRAGAQQFLNLTNKSGSGDIYITDNKDSPLFSQANRDSINSFGSDLQGFSQSVGTSTKYINFDAPMAQAADDIINAYLHAVDGAALDHSKQVTLGYIKNPDLLFITGAPGNTNHSFTSADDAVHAAALDVLQNLEVIGGDLLMKRAHQNSNRLQLNRGATARRRVRAGGWRRAQRASASMPSIHKSSRIGSSI